MSEPVTVYDTEADICVTWPRWVLKWVGYINVGITSGQTY